MNEADKCPKCGGDLEKGFIYAGKGVFWDTKEHKYFAGSLEILVSGWRLMPRAIGLRCQKCRLVLFHY